VASQLIEEVTAHAQSDCLEDAREICADGTYFPNNLRICQCSILQILQAVIVAREPSAWVTYKPGKIYKWLIQR